MQKAIIVVVAMLAIASIVGCQSESEAPTAKVESMNGGWLVGKLETLRGEVALLEAGAELKYVDADMYRNTFGDPDRVSSQNRSAALANAHREGIIACNQWIMGKPANVRAVAKVYCATWQDTLDAYVKSDTRQFTLTAGGAQYTRAKAEFEAVAED